MTCDPAFPLAGLVLPLVPPVLRGGGCDPAPRDPRPACQRDVRGQRTAAVPYPRPASPYGGAIEGTTTKRRLEVSVHAPQIWPKAAAEQLSKELVKCPG